MSAGSTALFTVLQGLEMQKAAKEESRALGRQGAVAVRESEREAEIRSGEVKEFGARQRLQFLKSGVRLAGTPLAVLAETAKKGKEEVDAIRGAGVARGSLLRSRAKITERGGRAALLGSFTSASATLAADKPGII